MKRCEGFFKNSHTHFLVVIGELKRLSVARTGGSKDSFDRNSDRGMVDSCMLF
jgi:hypothetical protein